MIESSLAQRIVGAALLSLVTGLTTCSGVVHDESGAPLPQIDSAWNHEDARESEQSFRRLLRRAEAAHDAAYATEVRTQLARALGLQERFAEASSVLDELEAALTPDMTIATVRYQLERGRLANSSGHPDRSIAWFEQALASAEGVSTDLAIDAVHMLAIVSPRADAIRWAKKGIEMARTSDDASRRWLGPLYNNLAWTYNDAGEYDKALTLFERDEAFRTQIGRPFEASIARWSRAKTLRMMGRPKDALAILIPLAENELRKGRPAEGYTQEEIGECLLALGEPDEAAPHFAIAWQRLREDPWLVAHEAPRLDRIRALANPP